VKTVTVFHFPGLDGTVQMANVYIPDGKKEYVLKRLSTYTETATNPDDLIPHDQAESRWWEVWLRNRDNQGRERFTAFAALRQLRTSQHYLGFGDQTVVLDRAHRLGSDLAGRSNCDQHAAGHCPSDVLGSSVMR
jgi:hypothetical protein